MDFDRWVYHESKQPKIIKDSQFEEYEARGWADTPAAFIKTTDFGIDPDDSANVQAFGETLEGIKDAANGALNLDQMGKNELEQYARKHFDVELDKRRKRSSLVEQIRKLLKPKEEVIDEVSIDLSQLES